MDKVTASLEEDTGENEMSSKKLSKQINISNMTPVELIKQDTIPDVKYQDIIYHMDNPDKTVHSKDQIHIDFFKATSEMKNLDWNYDWNYITFDNKKTNECVQFKRKGEDYWYADVPIKNNKDWEGYYWCSYSDTRKVIDMLKLFFEEVSWFGMLEWKMRRFKHE